MDASDNPWPKPAVALSDCCLPRLPAAPSQSPALLLLLLLPTRPDAATATVAAAVEQLRRLMLCGAGDRNPTLQILILVGTHDLLVPCALPPVEAVGCSTSRKDYREAAASTACGARGLKVEFGVPDNVCASGHDADVKASRLDVELMMWPCRS